ncbi:copper transporter [Corynebacterium liangguodongii]|uniref:Uncharacterized protein n=1 Tax=Corynebacterium liangguodongii TaxID=2079535 RepID=A0A2S0WDW6_9CORY|nr:copper transporter [Corynebacterium liangguodongii]AWB83968.1 hypothetical protein C3E79_05305 [Corynebacterium liangguodongii]PWB99979.1 hypothetical protein DF219_01945 [Corynebacterium liangguodongii]
MSRRTSSPGLVAAGLGWGLAAGLALGVALIAPAMPTEGGAAADAVDTEAAEAASERAEAANSLLAQGSEAMVEGVLEGRTVVIVRDKGVPDDVVDKQRWLLNIAGATSAGTITLTEKFTSQDAANELSAMIAQTLPAGAQLSVDNRSPGTHAGQALAAALDPASADEQDRAFLLDSLAVAGFIEYDPAEVGAADAAVLMTAPDAGSTFGAKLLEDVAAGYKEGGAHIAVSGVGAGTTPAETEAGRVATIFALR